MYLSLLKVSYRHTSIIILAHLNQHQYHDDDDDDDDKMGFFRAKQTPQGPLPLISIDLAKPGNALFNPDHRVVYKPNDLVSGTVFLNTPIAIQPQAIEVSLWGESRTWIRYDDSNTNSNGNKTSSYKHYRDNAPLFTVTLNLLEKPRQLISGESYTFPFQFRMPEGTNNSRADVYKDPNDIRWTTLPHHLPPTFFFGSSPSSPDNASISYGVTARLICPGTGTGPQNQDAITTSQELIFQPLNPHAHLLSPSAPLSLCPHTKPFILQSSVLTGQNPSTLGFRQRMHDRFSSSTPKLDFEFGIQIPDLLASGTEFRFLTSFRVLNKCEKVVQIPAVKFKILKLELRDITFFRAPRDWNCRDDIDGTAYADGRTHAPTHASGWIGQEDIVYREKKTVLNALPSDAVVVELDEENIAGEKDEKKTQQKDYVDCWFSSRIPGFTPPSFTSFAVSRLYRVKVRARIECGDKKFEYEAEGHVRGMGSCV
ncbi:hypothetical protein B0J11DRAFT_577158 [Dendryphion nanum]|uniref:Arrestin-like N-terminal domain-containing protein n=1 Tax=Dendryphion nanum TaxID=256645 RepID=A0A9P9IR95_9PLEO|nr:hypothetical protein B0J11DRAFT_577158 [Dendryphion nanum]